MDAREWLGLEATHNPMRWILPITPKISVHSRFLFGGAALGAHLEGGRRAFEARA